MQGRHVSRARSFARLSLIGAGLALAAAILVSTPRASAAPAGTLSMNPTNNAIGIGDTVAITFDLTGGVDVNAVHIGVTYNASVVQVVDADAGTVGVQVLPGPFPGDDTVGAVLTNSVSGGIINYQYELDGSAEVSGDGTVATVQFVGIAEGNANLSWSTRQLRDGNDVQSTPSGSTAIVVVGNVAPPPAETVTNTPEASATATGTSTPSVTATATATPNSSATATRTATATKTPASTGTPASTSTAAPTSTARVTVLQNSNQTPAGGTQGRTIGVNPSQTDRANGLPDAGNDGPGVAMWKWMFFAAALMLAIAGWFFTFAVHYGDRDVVLMDRFDQRRRDLNRRLPRR